MTVGWLRVSWENTNSTEKNERQNRLLLVRRTSRDTTEVVELGSARLVGPRVRSNARRGYFG